ncbi:MAG: GAF domain-containing protein, partial [Actinomycetota bacterium]
MKNRAWLVYLVAAVVASIVYFLVGQNSVLFNLIGLSSAILILVAIHIHKPERRAPWVLIALGQFVFIAGDVVSYNYARFAAAIPTVFPLDFTFNPEGDVPFPGPADALYLLVYPFLTAGIFLLIRARNPGRDRAGLIDSLLVAIGLGTVSWVFLIAPYTEFTDLETKVKLTAMAYPVADLLLAGFAIRLAVGAGRRSPAFYLMMAAIVALFVTDAIYAWFGVYTVAGYQPGSGLLEAGWLAFYVLLGMSALHPSMRELTDRAPAPDERLTFGRLALLTAVALTPPMLRIFASVRSDETMSVVLSGVTIVMFSLVILRMALLVKLQERSAERERALREAGTDLVTATSREGIHAAAIEAALAVTGGAAAVRLCEETERENRLVVVSASGGDDVVGTKFPLTALQEWKREHLLHGGVYVGPLNDSAWREPLGLFQDQAKGSMFVAPLFMRDEMHGLLVVATPERMDGSVADALQALSSQVALALESAALTEDLL